MLIPLARQQHPLLETYQPDRTLAGRQLLHLFRSSKDLHRMAWLEVSFPVTNRIIPRQERGSVPAGLDQGLPVWPD